MSPTSASMAGAALFAGAGAWALQQQAGYVGVSWFCGDVTGPVSLLTLVAVLLLLTGAYLSLGALRPRLPDNRTDIGRPRRFLALVGLMSVLLFLFAILMQAAASFFLPGCVG